MQAEEMQALLKAEPFQPIQVKLTNGNIHLITCPNLTMALGKELIIGTPAPGSNGEWASEVVYLEWSDIASVERTRPSETLA